MTLNDAIYYINTFLFWLLFCLLMWNGYILLFNKGVPNIRTARPIRKKIIEILKADMESRPAHRPYVIYDMGSGNGKFTRQIARALPGARVIGLEIAAKSYWWSLAAKRFYRLDNLDYIRGDFFAHKVGDAGAVVMFLTAYEMGRMGVKLHKDLKPGAGTLVISNRFALGDGWKQAETLHVKNHVINQGAVHIYRA